VCVSVRRCLLDVCVSHLLDIGEYLLQLLELLDGPLTAISLYIGQLFDSIKQFFTSLSQPAPPDSDDNPDDLQSPPGPPMHMPLPPTPSSYHARPPAMSSLEPRRGADVMEAPAALDLSVRRVQSTASAFPIHHSPQVAATRASQLTFCPQATATLDWKPQNPPVRAPSAGTLYSSKTTATHVPNVWPSVSKASDTLVQSSYATYQPHPNLSSLRPGKSVSDLKRQWSEAFCTEADPIRRRNPSVASTTPLDHEQPPLKYRHVAPASYEQRTAYEGPVAPYFREQPYFSHHQSAPLNHAQRSTYDLPVAPVNPEQRYVYQSPVAPSSSAQRSVPKLPAAPASNEQRSVYEGPVAPRSPEQPSISHSVFAPRSHEQRQQRSVADLTDIPAASAQSSEGPRGLPNDGNLCFVNCLLQSLAVIPELVSAVRHGVDSSADDDVRTMIGALSDVMSALHQPSAQSPVHTDPFVRAVSLLLPTDSPLVDDQRQTQQDVVEFFTSLLQLLRPHLNVTSGRCCRSVPRGVRYDTIRYGTFTCAQKRNEKIRKNYKQKPSSSEETVKAARGVARILLMGKGVMGAEVPQRGV